MVLNSIKLKQLNVELVKTALKVSEFGTKNSIAQETGLSVATCRNILDELILKGEVTEVELGPSTGGRPSRRFEYNENHAYVALIYLRIEDQVKSISISVVNMKGRQVYEDSRNIDDISADEIEQVVDFLLNKYPEIQVFSLGIPGIVQNGIIGQCDLEKLKNVKLEKQLSGKFNKIITIENDVNASALGYYQRMELAVPESLVYIYYPQGGIAGAGIIINGKIIKGKTNFAGEISYLPHWVNREEQGALQKDRKLFTNLIVDAVLSINCLINPEYIIISGQWVTEELKQAIRVEVASASPSEHIPVIDFESDIHESGLDGLKFAGIQKLSCGFEVVERTYK